MNKFSLKLPSFIDFGWGSANNLPIHVKKFGKNALVFTGSQSLYDSGIADNIFSSLKESGVLFDAIKTQGEPSVSSIDRLVQMLRSDYDLTKYDAIVAIGGGSVIDAAKAVSAMIFESGSVERYIENVGSASLSGKTMPLIAVPSTAGSGSEATSSAIIAKPGENGFKSRLSHLSLMPQVAIVDPFLTITLPKETRTHCIIECLVQILEAYTSREANSYTDALLVDALGFLAANMRKAVSEQESVSADVLERLSYAALLSGMGAENSSIAAQHSIFHAIGSLYGIAHSAICSAILYPTALINMRKVQMLEPESTTTAKFAMVGSIFSHMAYDENKHHVLLRAASQSLLKMSTDFALPKLRDLGIPKEDFYKIASSTVQEGNPVQLAETEIIEILELSW
ncbi:MAG: iron-containing alcohol dehydrogenase [Eubacteriaceae bacterium]|jgi:alcohol dehydrogenase class IV|nr:iron-containing alcohol dehydrogenase [Eubacteriaceae bacterium]